MPRKHARSVVAHVALALLLSGVLGWADPSAAGILEATWTAPTTNTDGGPLTDLASYLQARLSAVTSGGTRVAVHRV